MEDQILLAHLQALMGRLPDFAQYTPTSREHHIWLGQAHALISRWDRLEGISLRTSADNLGMDLIRDNNVAQILGAIHRAVADLELRVPQDQQQAFGPGDVYDFFNALRRVVGSAENDLLIVDPYLDANVIEQYLHSRAQQTPARLLLTRYADDVQQALERYKHQYGEVLEARQSGALHDRIVFIDRNAGWVIGQSIKDAAKAKPTYLVPLAPDVVAIKLADYEDIWNGAGAI